jgi:hypothetical protein
LSQKKIYFIRQAIYLCLAGTKKCPPFCPFFFVDLPASFYKDGRMQNYLFENDYEGTNS